MSKDYGDRSLELHKKLGGKLRIESAVDIKTPGDLALAYTPGVGAVCSAIESGEIDPKTVLTTKKTVAIITDGSAVLGLGNIGAVAGLPVMEGKAVLLREFAGVNGFPIALDTQDADEIIETVKNIAPTFGAINLEDIGAPRCFEIEKKLKEELNIPVFHDDQHGTAIVVLAGLINALKVVGKDYENVKVVISGAGAAGHAIVELLIAYGFRNLTVLDRDGVLNEERVCMRDDKKYLCETITNVCGSGDRERCDKNTLPEVIEGADVFIGVSAPNVLTTEMVKTMNDGAIVFALANPTPEIMPSDAKAGGARIVATGRSDFPNQINNALVFPGLFKGLFEADITQVTTKMQLNIVEALASLVENPDEEHIIPSIFNKEVVEVVAKAVGK